MDISKQGIDGVTRQQLAAAVGAVFETCKLIVETVRDAGRVPDGVLYSAFMSKGYSLTQYERFRDLACGTGLVRRTNNELVWVGCPELNPERN